MGVITSLVNVIALIDAFFFMEATHVDNKPDKILINNVSDFVNFAKSVNNGTSYSGTTVLLNSDIDFNKELSKQFEPIGKDSLNYFNGAFDGQGHIISNLKINSALSHAGLFGYSEGLTIKNVVLDDSCSIISSYSDSYESFVGGIIGYCWSKSGACIIENSINMASITFSGNIYNNDLNIGGIAGLISSYSPKHSTIVKNCANYGSITHSGKSERSFIGGITVVSTNNSTYRYIQNCVNYGTIAHGGTTTDVLEIGGIMGYSHYTYVENCLSAGKIFVSNPPSIESVGSIIGYVNNETYINYCFWTSDVGVKKIYDEDYENSNTTGTLTSHVIASDAVNELNAQVSSNGGKSWNKWLSNPEGKAIRFIINGKKYLSLSSQAILLPDIAGNNVFKFDGWYTDPEYSKPFIGNELTSDKELYGVYNKKVVVKFYSNIWDIFRKPVKEVTLGGAYGELPKPTRTGYTFDGWYTNNNEIITNKTIVKTAYGHILHAHWTPNKYFVIFYVNGGNPLSNPIKKVTYDAPYGDLEAPTKIGYTFIGWYTKKDGGDKVKSTTIVTTADIHILYAHWTANKYTVAFDEN